MCVVLSKTGSSGRSKHGEGKDLKAAAAAAEPMDWLDYGQPLGGKKEATNNNIYSNGKHEFREQSVSHSFQFPHSVPFPRMYVTFPVYLNACTYYVCAQHENASLPVFLSGLCRDETRFVPRWASKTAGREMGVDSDELE